MLVRACVQGYKTTVFHPKPPPASSPCSAICYNLATQCEKTDIPFLLYLPSDAQLVTDSYSLIVDAIFGNGYQPPMATDFAAIIQTLIRSKVPVISIDIPSGKFGLTPLAHCAKLA
jgi:NAD(P)H-hydrate epimerase